MIKPALLLPLRHHSPFPTGETRKQRELICQSNQLTKPRNGALPPHLHPRRHRGRFLRPLRLPREARGVASAARWPPLLRPVRRRRRPPRSPPLPRHLLPLPETPRRKQRHLHVQR